MKVKPTSSGVSILLICSFRGNILLIAAWIAFTGTVSNPESVRFQPKSKVQESGPCLQQVGGKGLNELLDRCFLCPKFKSFHRTDILEFNNNKKLH